MNEKLGFLEELLFWGRRRGVIESATTIAAKEAAVGLWEADPKKNPKGLKVVLGQDGNVAEIISIDRRIAGLSVNSKSGKGRKVYPFPLYSTEQMRAALAASGIQNAYDITDLNLSPLGLPYQIGNDNRVMYVLKGTPRPPVSS